MAKKKRNLTKTEKLTRVVVWLMLIATFGALAVQLVMTIMNFG